MIPIGYLPKSIYLDNTGELWIGGCSTTELANRYGTPLYVFDEGIIRSQCQRYIKSLKSNYTGKSFVSYACKAGINSAFVKIFNDEKIHLDVVSGGELFVALNAGFSPGNIQMHGNNKTQEELEFALIQDVGRIVVDNFHEIELLTRLAKRNKKMVNIWMRITPGVNVHTHDYRKTGVVDTKFGFSLTTGDAEKAVYQALNTPELNLLGLHTHIGSQITEIEPFIHTINKIIGFAAEIHHKFGFDFAEFSPGGGWGVSTPENTSIPSLETYVEKISKAIIENCKQRDLPLPELTLEPGRSIIGPSGLAIYEVGSKKEIPGVRTYISINGGIADNIRPPLYGANYLAIPIGNVQKKDTKIVTIAGKYCESGDILIKDIELPELKPGDYLAVPMTGAYTLAMSSNYNMALRPAVVIANNGNPRLIQRRETFQDLIARDVF